MTDQKEPTNVMDQLRIKIIQDCNDVSGYSEKIKFCENELGKVVDAKFSSSLDIDDKAINKLYGDVAGNLFGKTEAFFSTLISGWEKLYGYQIQLKTLIYKAGIAAFIAVAYRELGDMGASYHWALLTQAEDIFGFHTNGGETGKDILSLDFGFNDKVMQQFNSIVKINRNIVCKKKDWSITEAFSEDCVTKFAYTYPEYSINFASRTKIFEYKINNYYFESLIRDLDIPVKIGKSKNTKAKGDKLELLAAYLFLLIPGLVPRKNVHEDTNAFETDIVISNLSLNPNLTTDLFGRFILVECKNWEKKNVGVQDVGYFLLRMILTHSSFGVIFVRREITGNQVLETDARSLIRKVFHEDGITCIVIDEAKLIDISKKSVTFLNCIINENERIRFGKVKM
jgi:hypothetical protein